MPVCLACSWAQVMCLPESHFSHLKQGCKSLQKAAGMEAVMLQLPPKVQANADKKRRAEAWTLSQSSKHPAKVAAARKGLEAKLSKPSKSSQVSTWLDLPNVGPHHGSAGQCFIKLAETNLYSSLGLS